MDSESEGSEIWKTTREGLCRDKPDGFKRYFGEFLKISDLQIKLKTLISDTVDRSLMDKIGREVTDIVKTRTRKGFGVKTNLGPQTRLKGLSESYKKQRIRLKAAGKLSKHATPNKSNLTKSGDMIDSTKHKTTKNTVVISPIGNKNKRKAKYQAKAGRIAYNLSKSENRRIIKLIDQEFNKDINKKGL